MRFSGSATSVKGRLNFFTNLSCAFTGVGTDTEHDRAGIEEFLITIAESAGFLGASGRVVFRIKIKDHVLAHEVRERNAATAIGVRGEVWRLVAFLEFQFEFFGHNEIAGTLHGFRGENNYLDSSAESAEAADDFPFFVAELEGCFASSRMPAKM